MNFKHFTIGLAFKFSDAVSSAEDIYRLTGETLSQELLSDADLYISETKDNPLIDADLIFVIDNICLKKGKALYDEILQSSEIIPNLSFRKPFYQHNELYSVEGFRFLGTVDDAGNTVLNGEKTGISFQVKNKKKERYTNTLCCFYLNDSYAAAENAFRKQLIECGDKLNDTKLRPLVIGNSLLSTNIDWFLQGRYECFEAGDNSYLPYIVFPDRRVVIDNENEQSEIRILNKCIELGYRNFILDIHVRNTDTFKEYLENSQYKFEIINDENRSEFIFKTINIAQVLQKTDYFYQFGDLKYASRYLNFNTVTLNLKNHNEIEFFPINAE